MPKVPTAVPKKGKRKPKAKRPIARRTAVKKRNPKRKAKNFERTYHSRARVEFVKSLPGLIRLRGSDSCSPGSENAHVKGDGASRKAAFGLIVPLCAFHHTVSRNSLHALQPRRFEEAWGLDLHAEAARTQAAWRVASGEQT